MSAKVPHIIQYQGSKRKLALQILKYMPSKMNKLIEPFSGMAAISIAAAYYNKSSAYYINDINKPLVELLATVVNYPEKLVSDYEKLWLEQFSYASHLDHYYEIRKRFNSGEQNAVNMLYLLARCVKGSVRYSRDGRFNQSPDKRRHGVNPINLKKSVEAVSTLLKGKTIFSALDYHEILEMAKPGDVVYMDPPYQGVSNIKDSRYFSGIDFYDFMEALDILNKRQIDFLISYDGCCGSRQYGQSIPIELGCKKILLNAGVSTQATLLGKKEITYEALYLSQGLGKSILELPEQLLLLEAI